MRARGGAGTPVGSRDGRYRSRIDRRWPASFRLRWHELVDDVRDARRPNVSPRRRPLLVYFLLLIGLFGIAAVSAALYVQIQTKRDGNRAALVDARYAAQTAGKQLNSYLALVQATTKQLASNPGIAQ